MDSTLTLVDPSLLGHTVFVFSANSTLNARVHAQPSNALVYTLKSNSVGDRTEILKPDGTVLASVYRRIIAPTGTVRGEKRRLSKWFDSKGFPASFEVGGRRYEWRVDMIGQIACYEPGAPSDAPLAWYTRARRHFKDGVAFSTPTYFGFTAGVAGDPDLVDTFVAFWLLIVDRAKESSTTYLISQGVAHMEANSAAWGTGVSGI